MTNEEINKKAYEAYPELNAAFLPQAHKERKLQREGYIKALTELNIDAIRGEAMHRIIDAYENLPKIHGWVARDIGGQLTLSISNSPAGDEFMIIPSKLFPEIHAENVLEVELIIRRKED